MSDSIYLYESSSLSPIFTVSTFISLTFTPNIPIFTAIPQHIIVSLVHCTGYTALLKTLHSHFW